MVQISLNDLIPKTNYFVQIRAVSADGVPSEYSELFAFTTIEDTTIPSAVTGVTFDFTGSTAVAAWTRPTTNTDGTDFLDFKDYVVTVSSGATAKIFFTTTERFEFTLDMNAAAFGTPKSPITVTVAARDTGNRMGDTGTATATNTIPSVPVWATPPGVAGQDQVILKWNAVTDSDVVGYQVWVNNTSNLGTAIKAWSGNATTYIHNTVAYTFDHYFWVTAVDGFGQTNFSAAAGPYRPTSGFGVDTTPPPTTTLTVAPNGTDVTKPAAVRITWPSVTSSDFAGYHIRLSPNAMPRVWQYVDVIDKTATETVISGLQSQGSYVAQIRTYDVSVNTSAWSAEATGTASESTVPMGNITSDIQIINSGILRSSNYVESTSTVPGTGWYISPSQLNIEQGKINARVVSAGELRSNLNITDPAKGIVGQPLWDLNLDGNMSINDAQVRGKIVVGSSGSSSNNNISIASANYGAGGVNNSWAIRGDGTFTIIGGANAVALDSSGLYGNGFQLTSAGLFVTGTVEATSGKFSGPMYMNGSTAAIYSNYNGNNSNVVLDYTGLKAYDVYTNNVTASITTDGSLTARKGSIGGWTIDTNTLTSSAGGLGAIVLDASVGKISSGSTSNRVAMQAGIGFWAGSDSYTPYDATTNPSGALFRVTANGVLYAASASVTGTMVASNQYGYVGMGPSITYNNFPALIFSTTNNFSVANGIVQVSQGRVQLVGGIQGINSYVDVNGPSGTITLGANAQGLPGGSGVIYMNGTLVCNYNASVSGSLTSTGGIYSPSNISSDLDLTSRFVYTNRVRGASGNGVTLDNQVYTYIQNTEGALKIFGANSGTVYGEFFTSNSTGNVRIGVGNSGSLAATIADAGAAVVFQRNSGQVINGTNYVPIKVQTVISNSSIQTKTNVESHSYGLETLEKIRPVSFNRGGRDNLGFIAEEIADVMPEAVHYEPDDAEEFGNVPGALMGVDLSAMISLLMKSSLDLAEINKDQKKQIDELSKRLEKLEKKK